MPKPGPRPYECVRRAWHSDRHQPIRGSIIQEIFRAVSDVHGSATRKNREWQDNLPIVVLKTEEIMYSKANSEVEYSDLKTLWDRVNDAVDTIIRRDESTETGGEFLQPCIEAALHLGCTPQRASRCQRNNSPRCYLRPESSKNASVSTPNDSPSPGTKPYGDHKTIKPLVTHHSPQLSVLGTMNPASYCFNGDEQHRIHNRNPNSVKKVPIFDPSDSHRQANPPASWHVYPLYYSSPIQPDEITLCPWRPLHSGSYLDAPVVFGSDLDSNSSNVQGMECDLTLRLGSSAAPCAGLANNRPSPDRNKRPKHEEANHHGK